MEQRERMFFAVFIPCIVNACIPWNCICTDLKIAWYSYGMAFLSTTTIKLSSSIFSYLCCNSKICCRIVVLHHHHFA
jgi:hypothetical protein